MINTYTVQFTEDAKKQLKKLDKSVSVYIFNWIRKNLDNCVNPRQHGKPLTANHSGMWRYRIGDYRILADIQDDKLLILVIKAGHRRNVYIK